MVPRPDSRAPSSASSCINSCCGFAAEIHQSPDWYSKSFLSAKSVKLCVDDKRAAIRVTRHHPFSAVNVRLCLLPCSIRVISYAAQLSLINCYKATCVCIREHDHKCYATKHLYANREHPNNACHKGREWSKKTNFGKYDV